MQKDKHLQMNSVIFRDTEANTDLFSISTMTSDKKETHKGKEYFVIEVEISSASHPFYTNEERMLDTAGRVEKWKSRAKKMDKN